MGQKMQKQSAHTEVTQNLLGWGRSLELVILFGCEPWQTFQVGEKHRVKVTFYPYHSGSKLRPAMPISLLWTH